MAHLVTKYVIILVSVLGLLACISLLTGSEVQQADSDLAEDRMSMSVFNPSSYLPGISKTPVFFPGIYVSEAYRLTDDVIRLVYLQHRDNKQLVEARVENSEWQTIKQFCFNKTCDDYLFCDISTRIGIVEIDPRTPTIDKLEVAIQKSEEFFTVKVHDVRMKEDHKYPHQLGVCLQPIFYYSDWPLIIEFFESWIAQGATKFYFYVHSYTKQIQAVLDFYKAKLGDNLELIHWSDLPAYDRLRGTYNNDPNGRVFRHAAIAFMHDCMYRARSNVKYIANFDADEIAFTQSGNLSGVLDQIFEENPDAAQLKLRWVMAKKLSMNWDATNTPRDVDVSYDVLKFFTPSTVSVGYRKSSKLIHRPERVSVFDMHNVYRNERIIRAERPRYKTVNAKEHPDIFCLHTRRFERHVKGFKYTYDDSFDYSIFAKTSAVAKRNYSIRMRNSTFANMRLDPWAFEAREIFRNMEQCRREAFGVLLDEYNMICQQSSSGCRGMLMGSTEFIYSPISWQDIAHTALFSNYVGKAN